MIDLITEQLRNNQITAIQALEQAAEHTNAESLLRDAAFKMAEKCANLTDELKAVSDELRGLREADDTSWGLGRSIGYNAAIDEAIQLIKDLKK